MLRKTVSLFGKTAVPAALFVVALTAVAMLAQATPANASYINSVDIELKTHNTSLTAVSAAFCTNGHVNIDYQSGLVADPCNVTPYVTHIAPGMVSGSYTGNPTGVVVRAPNHRTLYLYTRNSYIGGVFSEVNGQKVHMVEGEVTTLATAGGGIVKLERLGDQNGHKIVVINIIKMGLV
jgi:hypothetical protein